MTKVNQESEKEEFETIDIDQKAKLSGDKQFAVGICKVSEIDDEERTVTAVISSDAIDRDGEILKPRGMNADNFVKNPVVPWSHSAWEPPIGKALWIKKGTKRILAKVKFAMTNRAEEVWQLFKGKFLNAFSVGFMPTKGHNPTPDEVKKDPRLAEARFIYDEWELLEFSPVTVPANPEALAQAVKSKSVAISKNMLETLKVEIIEDEPIEVKELDDEEDEDVKISMSEFRPEEKKIVVEPIFNLDSK